MKKRIITTFLVLFAALLPSAAQVNISSEMFTGTRTYEIKAEIKDSLTREPVAFASVYLHHPKDTLITDFTLSDAEGVAKLPKIPIGEVVFTVEMFGYKPFEKTIYVKKDVDLGEVLLKVDEQQLAAAKVEAAANPIEVLQDTLVYNAAAFKTGSNASLGDLLRKMPGIEVGDDGSVTVNGKAVSRITVGGKTFFMGDNSMALNNLPATIVNKVKVIDRDSKDPSSPGSRIRIRRG